MTNSTIPNWDEIEGNWKQLKGDAKQQWSKLTDEDVELVKGKYIELLDLLQKRYGHAKIQAEREISDWAKRLKSMDIATEVTALRDEVAKLSASVSQLVADRLLKRESKFAVPLTTPANASEIPLATRRPIFILPLLNWRRALSATH